ncbi:universal stress protein [Marilutibacter alkalisoli]|uniref:Universal stress protein n=1 Tax=Marilutibacter alkalisoli TaxID=2591633 RepID=A0A514BNS7_9GAMM|nr:universal stress protein [Lysobacter alkalisoli]QDH69036.1 universal stress protein [Lysobacter alkalisoli]
MKDLVMPMTGSNGDVNALEAAIALASSEGAHLSVLVALKLPIPDPSPVGMAQDNAVLQLHDELRNQAELKAARIRTRLDELPIFASAQVVESLVTEPPDAIASHARNADLVVMTSANGNAHSSAVIHSYFATLVMKTGRPVLMVPPRLLIQPPFRRVVIAWQPTREAARALHDAMPLLAQAKAIDVVMVESSESDPELLPDTAIASHLARHGLKVDLVRLQRPARHETVETVLLRHAARVDAQLLVAGGYGHSRFREWALGGTTRGLLSAMQIPILFSH